MTIEELQEEADRLTALHMDAFLVEFLGADASGLPSERIGELVDEGLINDETMTGLKVGADLDPFSFLSVAGRLMGEADPTELSDMREWGIERWAPAIVAKKTELEAQGFTGRGVGVPTSKPPTLSESIHLKDPPEWMSPAEKGAFLASVNRAGQYARGLGNRLQEDLLNVDAEVWDGEDIVQEVDPLRREAMLNMIREETARTTATTRHARSLAGTLADRSGYYAHNWQRIAVTELQGAHNEGRLIHAVESDGEGARVARIPETDACDECKRVFLDENQEIRVFSVLELQNNGTNVGRPRGEWLPTVFPVHPNCRCDLITVPEGFRVLEDGRLRKIDK